VAAVEGSSASSEDENRQASRQVIQRYGRNMISATSSENVSVVSVKLA
jgi:hypothetical protein